MSETAQKANNGRDSDCNTKAVSLNRFSAFVIIRRLSKRWVIMSEEELIAIEKEIDEKVKFLSSAKCNHTQHMYIDIVDDLVQGTLLSRILYWFSKDKNDRSKLRVFKDGYYWLAKQRKDWWEEIRITERQYDKAIKELENKGFVILAKYKFNSMPTIHIRPNFENINIATEKWSYDLKQELIREYFEGIEHEEIGNDIKCNSLGNNTKCKTGMTQDVNLLTYITNIDYKTSNTKHYSATPSHEYDFSLDIIKKAKETIKDSCLVDAVEYYLGKYRLEMCRNHPDISYASLSNFVQVVYEQFDGDIDCLLDGGLTDMIDRHFETNYGKPIDYKFQHFATPGIILCQARNCGLIDGYKY